MQKKAKTISNIAVAQSEDRHTIWQPENDYSHRPILAAILKDNPIPFAYRLNYVANFYVGPLIKNIENMFGMTRPEWIVLFCLNQQTGLNAQQISSATGRPKTSISAAVKQLLERKLISRKTDIQDGRRQVLLLTDAGRRIYAAIVDSFVAREADMLACLAQSERATFIKLLDKIIDNSGAWAKPY
jgi:DNA-binding MarR family transcriptional regulator